MLQKRDTRSANPATAFEPRICTFSNSQWHVKAELGNGRWQESSFYLSLISPDCKGTAMIIDELVQPLQRIPGVLVSDVFDFSGIHLWYPVVPFVFFFNPFAPFRTSQDLVFIRGLPNHLLVAQWALAGSPPVHIHWRLARGQRRYRCGRGRGSKESRFR